MPYDQFDRTQVHFRPLDERRNKVEIERDAVRPEDWDGELGEKARRTLSQTVERIRAARSTGRPVMLAFGAHTIKNGLGPVLIRLMEAGWVTHLATNGAGVIHDWEISYAGRTSEDVRENVSRGEFGNWRETGYYINLALVAGAYRGLGYGESVGRLIHQDGLTLPERRELVRVAHEGVLETPVSTMAAAAVDLAEQMDRFELPAGRLAVPHEGKEYSAQAAAYRLGVPFTAHPMFGHDIIYNHPMNHGAAVGRTAQRDFLAFAQSVSRLQGGVYLSVGSAVMSPMIFEKSISIARNVAQQHGRTIQDHFICVVDLAESTWDWTQGEPPEDHPDYYLRFYKTFHRMGGALRYARADNRDFLPALCTALDRDG